MDNTEPNVIAGRYELLERIGSGGFGDTWRGRDSLLDVEVAVKAFYDSDPDRAERGLREARSLARYTRLPGIVSVRDFVRDGNNTYLVMDYVRGIDLVNVIEANGRMRIERTTSVLRLVADALQTLHDDGYLHRDVSPENIRVQPNGTGVLVDFGSVLNLGQERRGTIIVKPGYAPPEQYGDSSKQGSWTDVYALAATVYHCICGTPPTDSMQRHFSDDLKAPSELGVKLPESVERALMEGLELDYHKRTQTVRELMAGLTSRGVVKASVKLAEPLPQTETPRPAEHVPTEGEVFRPAAALEPEPRPEAETADKPALKPEPAAGPGPKTEPAIEPTPIPEPATEPDREPEPKPTAGPGPKPEPEREPEPEPEREPSSTDVARSEDRSPRPDRKTSRKSSRTSGRSKKAKRWLPFVAAGVVIAIIVAVIVVANGTGNIPLGGRNPYAGDKPYNGHTYSSVKREKVTNDIIQQIGHDGVTNSVYFRECEIADEQIKLLAEQESIENVYLLECAGFTTLAPLAHMSNLKRLEIRGMDNVDLNEMFPEETPQVEKLVLTTMRMKEGTEQALSHFTGLTGLHLKGTEGIKGCAYLESMPNLSVLDLTRIPIPQSDLKYLADRKSLSSAYLSDCGLTSLDWVATCPKLRTLNISGNNITNELAAPLASCRQLQWLGLAHNDLTDVSFCESLTKLAGLDLSHNQVSDISKLASCAKITALILNNNRISDIGALANGFSGLSTLNVAFNEITSLEPLRQYKDMKYVVANNNQLTSLDGLQDKPELDALLASYNQISDISALSSTGARLEILDLGHNQIADISALSEIAKDNGGLTASVHLDYNNITSIESLSRSVAYGELVLYGNPVTDFTDFMQNAKGWGSLYLPYSESTAYGSLERKYSCYSTNIVGVPYDRQVQIDRTIRNESGSPTLNFPTTEEADAEQQSRRDDWNNRISGSTSSNFDNKEAQTDDGGES